MEFKLPVIKIAMESLAICWFYRSVLLKVLALPVFLVIVFDFTRHNIINIDGYLSIIILNAIYFVFLSFIFINCHRLFLLGLNHVPTYGMELNSRYFKFLAWIVLIAIIFFIVWYIVLLIILNLFGFVIDYSADPEGTFIIQNINWIEIIATLLTLYFTSRMSFVFPSIAIDGNPSIKWSWKLTNNNGLRVFVLIALLPLLFTEIIEFFYRDQPSTIEIIIFHIFSYLALSIEVAFLSITFKHFID
ncbi:MAG: hypothetical protein AAF410_02335, partial [Pseudomonadota bacterium]